MDISNFVVHSKKENRGFEYGVKLVPNLAMDRFVDSILTSTEKNSKGYNKYKASFKRRCGIKTILNNFEFDEKNFLRYIEFLTSFKDSNIRSKKFEIKKYGEIELMFLNKRMIKISSRNNYNKLFFVISKKELGSYINILKSVHLTEMSDSFIYRMNYITNPLSKIERDKLHAEVIYILIDGALDAKDRELFDFLCHELESGGR
ncbi:IDEAL domain-containing protein [Clostridium sp. JNZ X4-2]